VSSLVQKIISVTNKQNLNFLFFLGGGSGLKLHAFVT
jgi:alcohol dehydrogenase YqhD (iron-dependent ADH family)